MSGDIYGFDYDRAMVLKAVADTPRLVNQLHLKRRGTSGGSGGGGRVVFPPSGGIPAATLSSGTDLRMGTAECFVATVSDFGSTKQYTKGTDLIRVYNTARRVVGANGKAIQIKLNIDGLWLVDVEDCDS